MQVVVWLDIGLLVVGRDVGLLVVGRDVIGSGAGFLAVGFAVETRAGVRRNATSLSMSMNTPVPKPTFTAQCIRKINIEVSE
jgi:hypothetical protein